MLLNVAERLILLQILPGQGDVITLRVIREARGRIGLSEFELKAFRVQQDGATIRWDSARAREAEIEIGEAARGIVAAELRKLNDAKKLTEHHISLYEKFCERAEQPAERQAGDPALNGAPVRAAMEE